MSLRILICDDAGFIREILMQTSLDFGAEIVGEARDGAEILDLVGRLTPDLIFLDLVMPTRNGMEVAKDIKDRFPWIALVAVSSLDEPSMKQRALALGFDEWIQKPFQRSHILKVLAKYDRNDQEVKNG